MLTKFDDFPIHQTPVPISTPVTGEKDFYERYWFNGYSKVGDMYLGVGTARYPHLDIQDCGISIVHNGVQHAFHASARANSEPSDLSVGPFNLKITEPMKACRVVLEPNDTDFAADLTFEARTAAIEEPRHHWSDGNRRIMDTTRFTQFGTAGSNTTASAWRSIAPRPTAPRTAPGESARWPAATTGAPPSRRGPWGCSSCGPRCTGTTCAATTSCSRTPWAAPGSTWAPSCPPTTPWPTTPAWRIPAWSPCTASSTNWSSSPAAA